MSIPSPPLPLPLSLILHTVMSSFLPPSTNTIINSSPPAPFPSPPFYSTIFGHTVLGSA